MPSPRLPTLGNRTRSSALAYGIDGAPLPPDYEPPLPPDEASSPTTDAKLALDAAALQKSIMKAGRIRVGYRGRLLQPKDQPLINGIHSTDVSYIADRRGHGRSTMRPPAGGGGGGGASGGGTAASASWLPPLASASCWRSCAFSRRSCSASMRSGASSRRSSATVAASVAASATVAASVAASATVAASVTGVASWA